MGDEEKSIKLPQISEREMFAMLLSEDLERGDKEPAIASGIAVQMQHMELDAIPFSMRARIRDISARLPTSNAVLVGGGIGYLAAWLLDLWCGDPANPPKEPPSRPDSFRIIEPGGKFGVIINRLIGRYSADSWTKVITKQWQEVVAETVSWNAATATNPASVNPPLLPTPLDLVIIDVPESERSSIASAAFKILSQGGIMIVQEPEVPTGDMGVAEPGSELTPGQRKVESFNSWMDFVKQVSETHSMGFVELESGALAVIRK
ncbi:MAG: hypothetical protein QF831_00175 [Candidatus Thalassarchaeaceae archaeon]|jgi:hypothetical protein|nr:hypothetical protein [Candidatus Thalassarchaeaceae archaeon]MDP7311830.1 hypothetical protein [Candidatus Thalassarchaeaceae archaeon]